MTLSFSLATFCRQNSPFAFSFSPSSSFFSWSWRWRVHSVTAQFIYASRPSTEYSIRNTGTGCDGRSCH